jgi:hypothetical protein
VVSLVRLKIRRCGNEQLQTSLVSAINPEEGFRE